MILTTTHTVEGRPVREYLDIVAGEAIMGANVFRDFFAAVTDIIGGRAGAYESKLQQARDTAMSEMAAAARRLGADAVIGIDIDYEVLGRDNGMLMVTVSGTAVRLG